MKLILTKRELEVIKLGLLEITLDNAVGDDLKRESDMLSHKIQAAINEAEEE